MATGFTLPPPPPPPLDIHSTNVSEKWKRFKLAWDSYSLATELNKKSEAMQVATLLTIIGEDARDVFSKFTWESAEEATNNGSRTIASRGKTSHLSAIALTSGHKRPGSRTTSIGRRFANSPKDANSLPSHQRRYYVTALCLV